MKTLKLNSYHHIQNPLLEPIAAWVPTGLHVNTCFYSVNGLHMVLES